MAIKQGKILRKDYPRIRVIVKGEWTRYEVDCRSKLWVGKPRFTFEKKDDAVTKAQEVANLVNSHGKSGFTSDDVKLVETLRKKLLPYNIGPLEAVDRYIQILEAEKKSNSSAPLKEVTEKYLKFKNSGLHALKEKTLDQLQTVVKYLNNLFGSRPIGTITKENITVGIEEMKVSNNSKNAYLKLFSSFFRYAISEGFIKENPCDKINVVTVKNSIVILENEQVLELLKNCVLNQPKMVPYMVISLFSAIRPEELKKISWEHIDLQRNQIYVPTNISKVKSDRYIPISSNLVSWLTKYRKYDINPKNFKRMFESVTVNIKWVRDITRHTCLSQMVANSKNINEVAEFAGNSPEIIKAHYKRAVLPEDTKLYWKINPSIIETYITKGQVDQSAYSKFVED